MKEVAIDEPTRKEADTLKPVCLHMDPAHIAEARRLSHLIRSPFGRRMTASAVVRQAVERGLAALSEQAKLGH